MDEEPVKLLESRCNVLEHGSFGKTPGGVLNQLEFMEMFAGEKFLARCDQAMNLRGAVGREARRRLMSHR